MPSDIPFDDQINSLKRGTNHWPFFALAMLVLLALQVELVFNKSINWDEFFHLSQIHANNRGETVQWLQTPHVILFSWLPKFVSEPIDQVIWARLMLVPSAIITAIAIWATARRFTDNTSAAIAAIAWFGAGYVFLHSFALRADMLAAMLLTLAISAIVTLRSKLTALALAAVLVALAFVATVKSLLYLPAFAAVLVWRLALHRNPRALAIFTVVTIATLIAVLVLIPSAAVDDIVRLLKSSAERMFDAGLFPQGGFLLDQFLQAPLFFAFAFAAFWSHRKRNDSFPWWLTVGLVLPLLSVVIYRNSYPYFYAFVLPPFAIAAAMGVQLLARRYSVPALLLVIVIGPALMSLAEDRRVMDRQRLVHAGIAKIFPEPVLTIDDVAFRPDYPRAVPYFASGWALENYRLRGNLVYKKAIRNNQVPMLLRQGYALEQLKPHLNDPLALLPEDTAALRDNYIQHWGIVYVPGKSFNATQEARSHKIEIAGIYTVEGSTVTIDGEPYFPGDQVELKLGTVTVGPVPQAGARLRWGKDLLVPNTPFPEDRLFTNY